MSSGEMCQKSETGKRKTKQNKTKTEKKKTKAETKNKTKQNKNKKNIATDGPIAISRFHVKSIIVPKLGHFDRFTTAWQ